MLENASPPRPLPKIKGLLTKKCLGIKEIHNPEKKFEVGHHGAA